MTTTATAEAFPAGEILADELEARGWSQGEFAEILGRPAQFVSEIVSGKKEITRESAAQFAAALGTTPEFWLRLQDEYLLWRQQKDLSTRRRLGDVRSRARARELAPVSLLRQRGYITSGTPNDELAQVLDLYELSGADDTPAFRFAARRSNQDEAVSTLQHAWVACVRRVARELEVSDFDASALRALAGQLSERSRKPGAFASFQGDFAAVGVKLVYVEAFPGGKLDGCAFTMDQQPVIGVSGRGKRLDKVLFTILHETAHVLLGHTSDEGAVLVDDLSQKSPGDEADADQLAGDLAIPGTLPRPPARCSSAWVQARAEELQVHPLTVVGRLQNDGQLSWRTALSRNAPDVTPHPEQWRGFKNA